MNQSEKSEAKYIQINHKNKIEELSFESHVSEATNLINLLKFYEEDIGGEINKFFTSVLPENKEADPFKVIKAIASKTKTEKPLLKESLDSIMNAPETTTIILTRDLSEKIAIIIKAIFKKLKKVKSLDELKKKIQQIPNDFGQDFLNRYKKGNSSKNLDRLNLKDNRSAIQLRDMQKSVIDFRENKITYEFRELKDDKKNMLPSEMLILLQKFNIVRKLKLTISNNYKSLDEDSIEKKNKNMNETESISNLNYLQNIILILLNNEWLFQNIVELEVDLSDDNLLGSEINLYNYDLTRFSKLIHKDIKITTYQSNPPNKVYNKLFQKNNFPDMNIFIDKKEQKSELKSTPIITNSNYSYCSNSNDKNNNNNAISDKIIYFKNIELFNEKYKVILEMIIVYAYFIRKMPSLVKTQFNIPLNLGDEISEMLKRQKIFIDDFNFLSLLTNKEIFNSTNKFNSTIEIEFNSLENQTFEKLLSFLNSQNNIHICNLSFFPPEKYFKTELLLKILQNCDADYKLKLNKENNLDFHPKILNDLKGNEDLDNYILKKLAEYFEKNLRKFFCFLTFKTCIKELGFIFNIPSILNKSGYYNNVIMKFFLDLFIFLDKTINNITTFILKAENFLFDNRKYPILNDFCDTLEFYLDTKHRLTSLTFEVRFYRLQKIYRFIPYNLTYLSIGAFDYETFSYLVDYLTSSEYSMRTKLVHLTIKLNNSVIDISKEKIYENIIRLLTEYPKTLTEINLYSFLIISFQQLSNLLEKTNYNTLPNIFMQFSSKSSLKDKKFKNYLVNDVSVKVEKMVKLYAIKREENLSNKIVNLMMKLGKKNKDIMQYNIYSIIEKFLCRKDKKKVMVQLK